jgi:hypothetical protein
MCEYKFKIGDKVTYMGYDGVMSIDVIYDVWDTKNGQWVELTQNEVSLSPEKQKAIGLKIVPS